jgi:hypothetical protein
MIGKMKERKEERKKGRKKIDSPLHDSKYYGK